LVSGANQTTTIAARKGVGGFTAGLATTVIAFLAAMVVVWLAPETKGVKLQ
jgi:hypothetical protein